MGKNDNLARIYQVVSSGKYFNLNDLIYLKNFSFLREISFAKPNRDATKRTAQQVI